MSSDNLIVSKMFRVDGGGSRTWNRKGDGNRTLWCHLKRKKLPRLTDGIIQIHTRALKRRSQTTHRSVTSMTLTMSNTKYGVHFSVTLRSLIFALPFDFPLFSKARARAKKTNFKGFFFPGRHDQRQCWRDLGQCLHAFGVCAFCLQSIYLLFASHILENYCLRHVCHWPNVWFQ